jgi:hypothetical protein
MIRRKIGHLVVASTFVLAMLGAGSTVAFATDTTTPGSDLANDVRAGELGEKAAANDVDTAEEVDEDGAVEDVDEMEMGDSAVAQSQS